MNRRDAIKTIGLSAVAPVVLFNNTAEASVPTENKPCLPPEQKEDHNWTIISDSDRCLPLLEKKWECLLKDLPEERRRAMACCLESQRILNSQIQNFHELVQSWHNTSIQLVRRVFAKTQKVFTRTDWKPSENYNYYYISNVKYVPPVFLKISDPEADYIKCVTNLDNYANHIIKLTDLLVEEIDVSFGTRSKPIEFKGFFINKECYLGKDENCIAMSYGINRSKS